MNKPFVEYLIENSKEITANDAAGKYLMSRRITLPVPSPFLFCNLEKYRGLVCIANQQSVQIVFLTKNGLKDTNKEVVKKSYGPTKGNPVIIPATTTDTTYILLCEGPEDGLTLNQATGSEVWVARGLMFIASLPLIVGQRYVFVRDNDNLVATKTANKAIQTLISKKGMDILIAAPPAGIKDTNDLFIAQGVGAVRAMIDGAQPPTQREKVELDPITKTCAKYANTDTGNTYRFEARQGDKFIFIDDLRLNRYKTGCWVTYDNGVWSSKKGNKTALNAMIDTTEKIILEVDAIEDDEEAGKKQKWATVSQNEPRINAALKISKSRMSQPSEKFDVNPLWINFTNGVFDIEKNRLLLHAPEQYLLRQISFQYMPNAECPTWERFIRDRLGGDQELINFFQKVNGYCLTGLMTEQVMFFLFGQTATGKSTYIDTMLSVFGEYVTKTTSDMIMLHRYSKSTDPNPFLEQLWGYRLAFAAESAKHSKLNEAFTKEYTGDMFLSSRTLFEDVKVMRPTAKIVLATNDLPKFDSNDGAICRRLVPIPFKCALNEKKHELINTFLKEKGEYLLIDSFMLYFSLLKGV